MARLTRPQSQAQTRADLVVTARDLFLTDGFARTSLDRVAEVAGYSKGAVYSNFRGKNELCLAVLDEIHTGKFAEVSGLLAAADTLDERLDRLQEWAERTLGDVGWTMLAFEFIVAARHDEALTAALAATMSAGHGMVTSLLESVLRSAGITLPVPVEEAGRALLSMGIGLGIQRALDPAISAQLLTDGVRALLATALPALNPQQA